MALFRLAMAALPLVVRNQTVWSLVGLPLYVCFSLIVPPIFGINAFVILCAWRVMLTKWRVMPIVGDFYGQTVNSLHLCNRRQAL